MRMSNQDTHQHHPCSTDNRYRVLGKKRPATGINCVATRSRLDSIIVTRSCRCDVIDDTKHTEDLRRGDADGR